MEVYIAKEHRNTAVSKHSLNTNHTLKFSHNLIKIFRRQYVKYPPPKSPRRSLYNLIMERQCDKDFGDMLRVVKTRIFLVLTSFKNKKFFILVSFSVYPFLFCKTFLTSTKTMSKSSFYIKHWKKRWPTKIVYKLQFLQNVQCKYRRLKLIYLNVPKRLLYFWSF